MKRSHHALKRWPLLSMLGVAVVVGGCAGKTAPVSEPPPKVEAPAGISSSAETAAPTAPEIVLAPAHPETYVVRKGDTLWDIAELFLRDPWLWPEVWYVNPQIENPHLIYPGNILEIYPGDTIELTYDRTAGQPRLVVRPTSSARLQPDVRSESLAEAITTIPYSDVAPFLVEPRVVDEDELERAAYVLRPLEKEQLMLGAGDRMYVRGDLDAQASSYQVVRPGDPLLDPETGESLGFEAIDVGAAVIERGGDPALALATRTTREILIRDRLLPIRDDLLKQRFVPRSPEKPIEGQIIAVYNAVAQVGQYQVVSLNRGARDGLANGHVLAVYQPGGTAKDPLTRKHVELPDLRAGEVMVFRTYDRVSYALVMRSTRSIYEHDYLRMP
ncbi:MAG: LysM peptidoglycan-binding domain-containing protein [Pseudomonadota bacterium]|nr:LysM peptidoglycan-binding domain-containing protein [Pseudomonadota bacterium]